MKKSFIVTIVFLLIMGISLFTACNGSDKKSGKTGLEKRVSTYHNAVYVGANENFNVSFVTGEAEKIIVIDGEVGEMTPFATLTVTPLSSSLFNNTYTYLLQGETGERSGNLAKDVIGASFSAEVADTKAIGEIVSVKVIAEGIMESEISLTNKAEGALSWREILSVAERELAEVIRAESDTGNLNREIYIKLVNALADADQPYYYYVSFIKSSSDYWALLLDPVTGEVISKKI